MTKEVYQAMKDNGNSEKQIKKYFQDNGLTLPESSYGANLTRTVGQGLSFGFGDEIEAGLRSGFGMTGDYSDIRDDIRGGIQQFSEDNPKTAFGAELGGGLLTGGLGGAKALGAMGMRNAPKLLGMMGVGAAEGGLMGAGQAPELSDIPASAGLGAGIGAAGAGILGGGVRAVQGAAGMLPKNRALQNVRNALEESDITNAADAKSALADVSPGGVIADISEATRYNFGPAARQPGPGRVKATGFMRDRLANQNKQVDALSNWAAGSTETPMQRITTLKDIRRADFAPQYDALLQNPVYPGEAIEGVLKTGAGKRAFNAAKESYITNNPDIPAAGLTIENAKNISDLSFWNVMQSNMRETAKNLKVRQGKGIQAKDVNKLRSDLLSELDDQVPGYSMVRRDYRGASEAIDAISEGQNIFLKKSGNEVDVIEKLDGMTPEAKQEFLLGVMSEVKDRVIRRPSDANSVRQIVMYPATQRKLRAAFDNDQTFKAFNDQLKKVYTQGETASQLLHGSQTAGRQAEYEGLRKGAGAMGTLAQGRPIAAAAQGIGGMFNNLMGGMDRKGKSAVVDAYLSGGSIADDILERAFQGSQISPVFGAGAVSAPAALFGAAHPTNR